MLRLGVAVEVVAAVAAECHVVMWARAPTSLASKAAAAATHRSFAHLWARWRTTAASGDAAAARKRRRRRRRKARDRTQEMDTSPSIPWREVRGSD
jgi:hypothetical protein